MASLSGRIVTITGAASGMGYAFANLAASRGAKLALADIQQEPLEKLATELRASGVEVTSTVVDVSSSVEVDRWIDDTVKHYGGIDSSANMAGILGEIKPLTETTNEDFDRILGVNLYGVMHCTRAQTRVMKKGASIVNIASILGTAGQYGLSAYAVSKHGVVGLTKTVAKEVAAKGVRVNVVAPGAIDTPMSRGAGAQGGANMTTEQLTNYVSPMLRFGLADEVAKVVAFMLSDEASFVHGSVHLVDGGLMS